ncbi:MAG: hypothetical protein ACLR6B_13800 [Blautia sp.]
MTANALVNGKIFQVSTASGVIQGSGGWLYYKDSLDDYLGINQLSDRGLFNIAHTLSLMQKNLTARGKISLRSHQTRTLFMESICPVMIR